MRVTQSSVGETRSAMPGPTILVDFQCPENSRLFGCRPGSKLWVNGLLVVGPSTLPVDGKTKTAQVVR